MLFAPRLFWPRYPLVILLVVAFPNHIDFEQIGTVSHRWDFLPHFDHELADRVWLVFPTPDEPPKDSHFNRLIALPSAYIRTSNVPSR